MALIIAARSAGSREAYREIESCLNELCEDARRTVESEASQLMEVHSWVVESNMSVGTLTDMVEMVRSMREAKRINEMIDENE